MCQVYTPTWRRHPCLSPWALWPTNINENPRQGSGGTIDSVTGRRGRRGSGVVETVCLSDPERAYVPMIVHLPLPLAGASIARDAACEKLSWHALRSRDGRREDVSSDSGNRRTQEDASGSDSGRGRGRRRPVPTPPEWSHAGGTAGVRGVVGRTGGARSGDGIHGPVLEAGVARVEGRFHLELAQAQSNRGARGRKSDFLDAERLVRRYAADELTLSYVPDPEQRLWRTLSRTKQRW